ncbi:MAG: hypothetical protein FJY83_01705 [Candidatus Aminicenantes bacterium]|nr:hypothetical protein [Candidatus Aminicenantes bacterium]
MPDRPGSFSGPIRFLGGPACLLLALVVPDASPSSALLKMLESIHLEVKELGPRPGQDFISWNFFIGAKDEEDDDDTHKDRHVAIVIQNVGGTEKMTILVTRLEAASGNPGVRKAGKSQSLSFGISGGVPAVLSSDFGDEESQAVAGDILKAVRNKKKLLGS